MRRTVVIALAGALLAGLLSACGGGASKPQPTATPAAVPTSASFNASDQSPRGHFFPVTYVLESAAHVVVSVRRIDIAGDSGHAQIVVEGYAKSDVPFTADYAVTLIDQPSGSGEIRYKADRDAQFNVTPGQPQPLAVIITVPADAHFSLLEFAPRKDPLGSARAYVVDLHVADIPTDSSYAIIPS